MDDWTTLVKNAVAVLVILLAISVVLFLAYLGLNAANSGGARLADTTTTMDQRTFASYDQKQLRGTQVINAIQQFENQPVAVIVVTNRVGFENAAIYGAMIGPNLATVTQVRDDTAVNPGTGAAEGGADFNISELLNTVGGVVGNPPSVRGLVLAADQSVWQDVQQGNTSLYTHAASPHFINNNAMYSSVLIRDLNDRIVGVYLEQISGTRDFTGAQTGNVWLQVAP